ncbi:MAG: hypothetical protein WA418_01665 [Bradyrhizobium sp.]
MGTVIEALAVIKGKDETGPAVASITRRLHELSRAAGALGRDLQKQMSVAASTATQAERHIARAQKATERTALIPKLAMGGLAVQGVTVAAQMAFEAAHKAIEPAFNRQHERVRMLASGMKPEEIDEAEHAAQGLSKEFKAFPVTSIMHTLRNARAITGSYHEAAEVIRPLIALGDTALGAHPERRDEILEQLDSLSKSMEIRGVTQDTERFKHVMDLTAKAINVNGDTLKIDDFAQMAMYSRAAGPKLSDEFFVQIGSAIAQEFRGAQAGTAFGGLYNETVGGHMNHVGATKAHDLGITAPGGVHWDNKHQHIMGLNPGGLIDMELLQANPLDWYWKHLDPALNNYRDPKTGKPLSEADKNSWIQTMFPGRVGQLMGVFRGQAGRLGKDVHLQAGALGVYEGAHLFEDQDPLVKEQALKSGFDNLLADLGGPAVPAANRSMNMMQTALQYMDDRLHEKPSASDPTFGRQGAGTIGAPIVGNSLITGLKYLEYRASPRARLDALDVLDQNDKRVAALGMPATTAAITARNALQRQELETQLADFGYAKPDAVGRRWRPGVSWSVGGDVQHMDDIRAAVNPAQAQTVTAQVEGQATVGVNVTVDASPDLLAKVDQRAQSAVMQLRQTGTPATGTAGSLGASSPDASPSR